MSLQYPVLAIPLTVVISIKAAKMYFFTCLARLEHVFNVFEEDGVRSLGSRLMVVCAPSLCILEIKRSGIGGFGGLIDIF